MNNSSTIEITVSPRSSRSMIKLTDDGSIKAYLNSPPVDGKANAELIKLLSKKLKIPQSNIVITGGAKNKKKRLCIENMTSEEILKKLKE